MRAPTHITAALLFTAVGFSLAGRPLHTDGWAMGSALLGGVLPDIDHPRSPWGKRLLGRVSNYIRRRWSHRTATHSLRALLVLGGAMAPFAMLGQGPAYAALLLGFASHLLLDCATKKGVPLFYPEKIQCVFPRHEKWRLETGSRGEWVLLVVLLLGLVGCGGVSAMGGFRRVVRYVAATPAAAYNDYREATTETVLCFQGRWQDSRQPVEGEALILEGRPDRFLIAFQGHIWAYGETGDIVPQRSRVRITSRPLRVNTLAVHGDPFPQILAQIPQGAFVSGDLESTRSFTSNRPQNRPFSRHQSLQLTSQTLVFHGAPRWVLARLHPRPQVDPQRLTQLQTQVAERRLALEALRIHRPPVHYLKVRSTQAQLHAQERQLAALQDTTVGFTGVLFLRLPGEED